MTSPAFDNQYWMIKDLIALPPMILKQRLEEGGHHYGKSSTKARLVFLAIRLVRGLMSYEKCDTVELTRFCAQRRLRIWQNVKKRGIINLLERADEDATFDNFLSLPPELRNQIVLLHFQTFDSFVDKQLHIIPPPISRVSRQLRQETLFLFLQTCTISIRFEILYHPRSRRSGPRADDWYARPDRRTTTFFKRAPQHFIANIRNFQLSGLLRLPHGWVSAGWLVKIGPGDNGTIITFNGDSVPLVPAKGWDAARDKVEKKMRAELERAMEERGHLRLCRGDLEMFTRIFTPED